MEYVARWKGVGIKMEQIGRAYGRFLLEAVVFALLIVLLFGGIADEAGNRGIFRMIGGYLQEDTRSVLGEDFQMYQLEGQKNAPMIDYVDCGIRYVGKYSIESIVQAKDYTGQYIPVKVRSFCNPRGIEQIGAYMGEVTQIQFAERGIYVLEVSATDAWNRMSTYRIRIPIHG